MNTVNKQELMLELSSKCNLQCKMCAFRSGFTGQEMSKKHIQDILKDIPIINAKSKYYTFDSLRVDGNTEPIMYKDLDFVIAEGRKVGIEHFNIVSNGVLLTENVSNMLLEQNIDSIDISMTGIIPEVYGNFQGYGLSTKKCNEQIKQIIDNVKFFVARKKQLEKNTIVTMRYIVTKENGFHYADYVNFFRKTKVNAIMAMTLTTNVLHTKCSPLGEIIGRKTCDSPNHPVVCANGDVLLSNCQYDIPILGNVFKTSFADVLLAAQTERYVEGIIKSINEMMPLNCRNCYNTHVY